MQQETLSQSLPLRWLYVDFNSYFASVEQQMNPALRGKPVIVVPVDTDATCAIAASYEAKAMGIKTNTPVYEAKRMCPGLVCVVGDHKHYVHYHHQILKEVENHIPVKAVCSIDEVACYLMDNENSDERATEIAHSIKAGLARNVGEYIKCSVGVAPNRFLAKVATDMKKPDGLTILHQEDLPQRLYGLKLRDIPGIGHNMEKRILMAGINNMRALLALSVKEMRKIWGGVWGERMWFWLRGVDLPELETHRSTVGHSHVMAPELRMPERARYVARRLTMKAASRLRRMGYYAQTLTFSARFENGFRVEGSESCFRAQDSVTFLHMLERIWQSALEYASDKGRGGDMRIKKVSMALHGLVEAEVAEQPELIPALQEQESKERARAERMSQALDRINHRFGKDSVTMGMMPEASRNFSGTKVAFTRIPDIEEFVE